MPLVPIIVQVEESDFFPTLRTLRKMPACHKVELDWGSLGNGAAEKKAKKDKQPAAEGEAKGGVRGAIKQLLVALMLRGPQHLAVLKKAALQAGYAESSVTQALNEMRRAGYAESGGLGIHQLTSQAYREMKPEPEALALPPPAPDKGEGQRAKPGAAERSAILCLQGAGGSSTRQAMAAAIAADGGKPSTIAGVLMRLVDKGLIKGHGAGNYELTAKGRKLEPGK
jgi:Mn-dependent DtxR family transcriptional regulator